MKQPIKNLLYICKSEYHGGRNFKRFHPGLKYVHAPLIPLQGTSAMTPQAGPYPPARPLMDPTSQIPAARAPVYLDYERQIEASKRMNALEASEQPKTTFLEPEDDPSSETALTESGAPYPTALSEIRSDVDQFTTPSAIVKEYGYTKEADLQYYNMPNTKVLEFHTAETVGRPLVETPDPVFVPDEHWVWEDPLEAIQDAYIYEETVMDR